MDGEWDRLQGTFSVGEITYTKELKHGLMKHWCVHYSRRRAAGISEWEWSGSKGLMGHVREFECYPKANGYPTQ